MQLKNLTKATLLICATAALTACGGGGGGIGSGTLNGYLADYAQLKDDPTRGGLSPQSTIDLQRGAATYTGVINIGIDQPEDTRSYLGGISMTVNFVDGPDAITGSAQDFVLYTARIASPDIGNAVSGSLAFSGTTTANNGTIAGGLAGTMTGAIEGVEASGTFDGNLTGLNANGMSLYFDGTVIAGGVALLAN